VQKTPPLHMRGFDSAQPTQKRSLSGVEEKIQPKVNRLYSVSEKNGFSLVSLVANVFKTR